MPRFNELTLVLGTMYWLVGEFGSLVTCGSVPFAPFARTVFTTFALAVTIPLEFIKFRELSLEYGGGAGVAAGLAVFGVGSPMLGLRR